MSETKKHFDFDLSFLYRDDLAHSERLKAATGYQWNWTNIAIICALLFIAGLFVFESSSDNASTPSTSGESSVGRYRCSRSASAELATLSPSENKEELDAAKAELDSDMEQYKKLKSDLELSRVTESSSQYEIDAYNVKVEELNAKLSALRAAAEAYDARLTRFNTAVEAYNSYLQNNCRDTQ